MTLPTLGEAVADLERRLIYSDVAKNGFREERDKLQLRVESLESGSSSIEVKRLEASLADALKAEDFQRHRADELLFKLNFANKRLETIGVKEGYLVSSEALRNANVRCTIMESKLIAAETRTVELDGMNAALERQVKDVMAAKDTWGKRFFEEQASLSNAAMEERERIAKIVEEANNGDVYPWLNGQWGAPWEGKCMPAWLRAGAPDSSSLDVPKREAWRYRCAGCGTDRTDDKRAAFRPGTLAIDRDFAQTPCRHCLQVLLELLPPASAT